MFGLMGVEIARLMQEDMRRRAESDRLSSDVQGCRQGRKRRAR